MPATVHRAPKVYDLVLFGATGFTGELAARYLDSTYGPELNWAIAGRNGDKLEVLKQSLDRKPAVLIADVARPSSLVEMAKQCRVVASTVGPYIKYGEPVVQACVAGMADYLDITGEPEFVDQMIQRYHAPAKQAGIRLVHCCGFDSIPHDLGAYLTVKELNSNAPIHVQAFVKTRGAFSGGTWTSAVNAMGNFREYQKERRSRPPPPWNADGRSAKVEKMTVHRRKGTGSWAAPLPTIDPQIVVRSARALPIYGPKFRYGHYASVKTLRYLVGGAALVTGMFALAQIKPTRDLLLKAKGSGEGPTKEKRAKSWFEVTLIGTAGKQVVETTVRGGDPGYDETAKMLSEAALCLVNDRKRLSPHYGNVTTAQVMGDVLLKRLRARGMEFSAKRIR